jgi:hypothetical protein
MFSNLTWLQEEDVWTCCSHIMLWPAWPFSLILILLRFFLFLMKFPECFIKLIWPTFGFQNKKSQKGVITFIIFLFLSYMFHRIWYDCSKSTRLPPAIKLNLKTLTDRRNSQSIHSKNKRLSSACIVQTDFV